eukprot:46304_1
MQSLSEIKEDVIHGHLYIENNAFKGMNAGSHTWTCKDAELIKSILSAKNKQSFQSDPFTIAKLKWQMKMYPNGNTPSRNRYVNIFLKLLSIPCTIDQLTIAWCITCNKSMVGTSYISKYTPSASYWGLTGKKLPLSQWKSMNIKDLSISITINIIDIILNNNSNYLMLSHIPISYFKFNEYEKYNKHNTSTKTVYKWKMDPKTVNIYKQSATAQTFQSHIFDNMWKLETYLIRTGNTTGFIGICLRLCNVPPFIYKIATELSFICKETEIVKGSYTVEFDCNNQSQGIPQFMSLTDINALQIVTFAVQIKILNVKYIEFNKNNINHIYDPMQINQILSIAVTESDTEILFNSNHNILTEIQSKILKLDKQMIDLRLIMCEEKKNDDLDVIKDEIKLLKQMIDKIQLKNKRSNIKYTEMQKWMTEVVKLPEYIDLFINNGLEDMNIIKDITMETLTVIGIQKIGHKMKIIKQVAKLNTHPAPYQSPNHNEGDNEGGTGFYI